MKILITGAKGFIGKNLVAGLRNLNNFDILEYDIDSNPSLLEEYCKEAEFVFHLAGVNRPKDPADYMKGNFGFTATLLATLYKYNNTCPVMLSSSIHAASDHLYGKSKKAGEDMLFHYGKLTGAKVVVYRFPNVFGKWSRPDYNSAVATFCHHIAHGQPVTVNDPDASITLVYIEDVIEELIHALHGKVNVVGDFCEVPTGYTRTLGEIVDLIYSFKKSREDCSLPDMSDAFTKKLYSTYLSYLPENEFSYELKMKADHRGSFTEFIKTPERGQVSVNIIKPGITKGNHWHNTKSEKFLVASGNGVIRFRKIDSAEIIEYVISDKEMRVVDIPPGYTHHIENLGDTDMVTIMWASECFDPKKPDTYLLEV